MILICFQSHEPPVGVLVIERCTVELDLESVDFGFLLGTFDYYTVSFLNKIKKLSATLYKYPLKIYCFYDE